MNSELFSKMSRDMNIYKYSNEPQKQFETRVLYSSIILWLKVICLDEHFDNDEYYGISKNYFHRRADFILNHLMSFFSEYKSWAEMDNCEIDIINFIRDRLIKTGNIIENDNRVILSIKKDIVINEGISQKFGVEYDVLSYTLGASIIKKFKNEYVYNTSCEKIDSLEKYFNNIKFNIDKSDIKKEYFDPFIKTDTFYKSWSENKPNCETFISRINGEYGQVVYFVEKSIKGITYTHKISDFVVSTGMLKKLLLFLRHKYKNPLSVSIYKYSDYFILNRYITDFAGYEEQFVQSLGWPINSLADQLNWCFSIEVYNYIIKILSNLLIEIKEVHNE